MNDSSPVVVWGVGEFVFFNFIPFLDYIAPVVTSVTQVEKTSQKLRYFYTFFSPFICSCSFLQFKPIPRKNLKFIGSVFQKLIGDVLTA